MAKLGNKVRAFLRTQQWVGDDNLFRWFGGEVSNAWALTAEAVETSTKSNDWTTFIAGKRGATLEVTVYADASNEGQTGALEELALGNTVEFLVGEVDGADIEGDYGVGVITAVSDTNDFGAVASRTISVTITDQVEQDYAVNWDEVE